MSPANWNAALVTEPEPTAESAEAQELQELEVELRDGSRLHAQHSRNGSRLRLLAPDHRCLLEYDTRSGNVRIEGPLSRVALRAPAQGLDLSSAGDINLQAEGLLRLRGDAGVRVQVGDAADAPPALSLGRAGVTLATACLDVFAQQARARFGEAEVSGNELNAAWSRALFHAETFELRARELHQRAQTWLTNVEETWTTRAGHVRESIKHSRFSTAERQQLRARKMSASTARRFTSGDERAALPSRPDHRRH